MSKSKTRLNTTQIRFLRGRGHHLSPLAMVGKEGISRSLVQAVEHNLLAHELIKVRVQNTCLLDRKEAATALAEATRSQVVQVLGRTFLLFKENRDRQDEGKIILPRKKK